MKKFYWLLGLFLIIYSCTEVEDCFDDLLFQPSLNPATRFAGDGKFDVLGYGYDVTGEYLHPLSVRNPVLDIAKYEKDYFDRIQENNSSYGFDQMYYGYSASDYTKDITKETNVSANMSYGSEKVDTVPYFSGNITNNNYLKTEYAYSDKYSFASVDAVRNRKHIWINDEVSFLSNYLSESFITDMERLSPDRLVERYGTHVLTDFIIGGRYKLMYRSVITHTKDATHKKTTVASGLKAALFGIGFSLDISRTVQTDETLVVDNQNKELYVMFYGGNGTSLKYDLEKGMPTGVDVQSWENSVNLSNSCLNEIIWKETYPIYDFILDLDKKEEVKQAVIRYMLKSKLNILELLPLKTYYHPGFGSSPNHDTTSYPYDEVREGDWTYSRLEGYILKNKLPETIPLYQYYFSDGFDHYTTIESDIHLKYKGWTQHGIMGYVYKKPMDGTSILYEYYNSEANDHYTSTFPILTQLYPRYLRFNQTSGYIYNPD